MTHPPEFAPHRTETQILGDDIARAMKGLRKDWPHMLPKGGAQVGPGWASRSGIILDDHDPSDADIRRIDRIVSLRRYAVDVLNSWARVVVEDRNLTEASVPCRHGIDVRVTLTYPKVGPLPFTILTCMAIRPLNGGKHAVDGADALDLAEFLERHADWISGHEAAQDCRDELVELSRHCHRIVNPPARESMSIGRCPLADAETGKACTGDVRVRLTPGESDGEAYATCTVCGEAAVASWWESQMFDDPETRRWLTDADVVTLIHRLYGEVIAQSTVRGWVRKGILVAATTRNDDGRRLFDRDAVVYAIDLYKRRQAAPS